MRTPSWETSSGALAALLGSGAPLEKTDVYTITLRGGTVYRWSAHDLALQLGSRSFGVGPGLWRSRVRYTVGIDVDKLTLRLTDNTALQLNGRPFQTFVRGGGFDGALVQLERVFWGAADTAPVGALLWFVGNVIDTEGDRNEATLSVASYLQWLRVQVPNGVYQTKCLNTLFDPQCGLSRTAFTVTGSATGATDSYRSTFTHSLGQTAGWFSLGVMTFTSGANAGISRTCKLHTSTVLTALQPWPFPVAPGDDFTITPGCDRLKSTCQSAKFNNLIRFRATPFVPAPETVL